MTNKAHIIAQLKKELLPLQGFRSDRGNSLLDAGLGPIKHAFPNAAFPLAAIHEFISSNVEDTAATTGFVSAILAALMKKCGAVIWISSGRNIFPPALQLFGIPPQQVIFIDLKKEKEMLWAVEEALKCEGLAAVIGEIPELDFTASRRLQLAVETSRVTGFILRRNPRVINTTSSIARWKITSLPGNIEDEMPGVGFPRWNVQLLKIRNGKPGNWEVEFAGGKFRHVSRFATVALAQQKKTG